MSTRVIGVDPGPTPGIVRLHIEDGRLVPRWTHVVQCSANVMPEIVGSFLAPNREWAVTVLAVERFVSRGRANAAQSLTRDQVGFLTATFTHAVIAQNNASRVKAWATDKRLDAAGLLEACKGMRHARDACRHALFAVVDLGHLPDPLSKEWQR